MSFDKMLADKARFIPKSGFNLVGLDDFEEPGAQLILLAHYSTREKAEAGAAATAKDFSHGDPMRTFIYGPDDH